MNDFLKDSSKKQPRISDLFRELGDEAFLINSDCIFTKNKILVKNRIYQILDLLDNGAFNLFHIKLLHAYLKGFDVFIVGIDIVTGEVLYRHHRLDAGILPCDFLIVDLDYFEKEVSEDTIRFFCKRKQPLNDAKHEYHR